MSNLSVFDFEGRAVRFVGTSEQPEWVASDVVAVLYPKASKDSYRGYLSKVPKDWKGVKKINTLGGNQSMVTVLEPGLYHLICRSSSSRAINFQRWVYEEVLPTIRKTGSYATPSAEATRLTQLEQNIQSGLSLIEQGKTMVWLAVAQIQCEELWKAAGFASFPSYCKKRWGWSRSNAYEISCAGKVVEQLKAFGIPAENMPTSISQVRPLLNVEEQFRPDVWRRILETAEPLTADLVERTARPKLTSAQSNNLCQISVYVDQPLKADLDRLSEIRRRSLSSLIESICYEEVQLAKANGEF